MSFQDLFGAKYGADGGALYHKIPFESYTEDWQNSIIQIGDYGWDKFSFLFFHPDGDLCGVQKELSGGGLVKAPPPSSPTTEAKEWLHNATLVAKLKSASDLRFLFFDPEGKLYGVFGTNLYSGPLQSSTDEQWRDSAKLIGESEWNSYEFLFFDPEGILYGHKNGKLHKRSPPTDPTDDWLGTSELIGTTGWRQLRFLFFMSNGELYVVAEEGEHLFKESLYKGLPPTQGMSFDKWLDSSSTTLIAKDDFNVMLFLMSPIKVWFSYLVLRLRLVEKLFDTNRSSPKMYVQPEHSQLKRKYIWLLHKSVFMMKGENHAEDSEMNISRIQAKRIFLNLSQSFNFVDISVSYEKYNRGLSEGTQHFPVED